MVAPPALGDDLGLAQGAEDLPIEQLIAQAIPPDHSTGADDLLRARFIPKNPLRVPSVLGRYVIEDERFNAILRRG
jgi:hypothetical protein